MLCHVRTPLLALLVVVSFALDAEAGRVALVDINGTAAVTSPDVNGNYWNTANNSTGTPLPLVTTYNGATPWSLTITFARVVSVMKPAEFHSSTSSNEPAERSARS